MSGPLDGLRILEIAGLGPAPFAGMLFADLGADVLRVDRPAGGAPGIFRDPRQDLAGRGKRSVAVDLKRPEAAKLVRRLGARADALIEGFRPGVVERLGIGPADCHAVNPRLVYGRMTGWGQDGPLAHTAGHDLGYLALSGVLHAIGTEETPIPPLNLIGDYGGGGALLVVGVLAALWRVREGGVGQVVDASIVDGAALLGTVLHGMLDGGLWRDTRRANLLDGAAPNYGVYRTADGHHLAVGPLEPRFWAEFVTRLGDDGLGQGDPYDPDGWPALRERIAARIATRTRAEWLSVFDGGDACVAPVLSLTEARTNSHPHLAARQTYVMVHGVAQPAPAPRFSVTPAALTTPPPRAGEHTREALADWGIGDVDALLASGVLTVA